MASRRARERPGVGWGAELGDDQSAPCFEAPCFEAPCFEASEL